MWIWACELVWYLGQVPKVPASISVKLQKAGAQMIFLRLILVQGAAASVPCWIAALDVTAPCTIRNLKAGTCATLRKRSPHCLPLSIIPSQSASYLGLCSALLTISLFLMLWLHPSLSLSPSFLVPSSCLCTDLFLTGLVTCEPGKGSSVGHKLLDSTYDSTSDIPEAWITGLI